MRGLLITLEGGEGTGKSTQLDKLVERFAGLGHTVERLREPGCTALGDRVRAVLLDPSMAGMSAWTEAFLYEASRSQLVTESIAPALEAGEVIVCDRFTDSTLAYQGWGRGLDLDVLREMNAVATGGATPDATIVLDLDPVTGVDRATKAGADRLEAEHAAFHEAVRKGFAAIAAEEPERVALVDASGDPDEVAERVWAALRALPAVAEFLGGTSA